MAIESPASASELQQLREAGYVLIRQFLPAGVLRQLNSVARAQLEAQQPPLELEADLRYPGAPTSRDAIGGKTVRRLLNAFDRAPEFASRATANAVRDWMASYFQEPVCLSRAHHNCLMTKHPQFGSLTGWHRDIRYWSFEQEDLVSVWMALGEETQNNGGLWFVPGSHRMAFEEQRFDAAKFFRADRADNAALIATAVAPSLQGGDAVFFHCNTLHSAGQNLSAAVKMSLVYTYHGASNRPLPGTRSSSQPEVALAAQ